MNYEELTRQISVIDAEKRYLLDILRCIILNEYPKYIILSMGEKNKLNHEVKELNARIKKLSNEKKELINKLESISTYSNFDLADILQNKLRPFGYRVVDDTTENSESSHIQTHMKNIYNGYDCMQYEMEDSYYFGYAILSPNRFQDSVYLRGLYTTLIDHNTGLIKKEYQVDPIVYEILKDLINEKLNYKVKTK